MVSITTTLESLKDLLDNKNQFIIPEFQREFVWTEKEIYALFQDFQEDTENFQIDLNQSPGYLLGNIVLISHPESNKLFEVIDGQQRLTTLTLLFCIMAKKFLELFRHDTSDSTWSDYATYLKPYYMVIGEKFKFSDYKIKHTQDINFVDSYQSFINPHSTGEPRDDKYSDNIEEVVDAIENEIDKISKEPEKLIYLYEYLTTQVKVIVTITPSMNSALHLFDILNNRGKSLEPMDLVKNYLLKSLTSFDASKIEQEHFIEAWNEFIDNLRGQKKSENIHPSRFVKHFIIGTEGINVKQKDLFNHIKLKRFESKQALLAFAKQLKETSFIYASIERNSLNNEFLKDNDDMYVMFDLLGTKQIHSLLIPFYSAKESQKEELLKVVSLYVAAVVFSNESPNNIEKELPSILKSVLDIQESDVTKRIGIAITAIRGLIKDYVEIVEALLPIKDLGDKGKRKSKKGLQILKYLELKINKSNLIKTNSVIELEHIMPYGSDFKEYGFVDEDERLGYLNRIGNLTLLSNRVNQSASNLRFEQKIEHYKQPDSPAITRGIVLGLSTSIKADKERINFINNHLFNECNLKNLYGTKSKLKIEE